MASTNPPERVYPESIEPSETNGQILKTVSGEAVWADETGGGGGGGGGDTLDLDLSGALLYYLDPDLEQYGLYDGTGIVSNGSNWPDYSFTEIPPLDPTHTYELTATFDTGYGGTYGFSVWGMATTDDDGWDTADYTHALYDDENDASSGEVTFQIGPGINGWDTSVVAEGNLYLVLENHRFTRLIGLTFTDLTAAGGGGDSGETSWTAPSFENSWTDFDSGYAPAGYRKDGSGVVHLRGVVTGGTISSNVFTLPAGYIPPFNSWFSVVSSDSGGSGFNDEGVAYVGSDGAVIIQVGFNPYVSLDGISFYTD